MHEILALGPLVTLECRAESFGSSGVATLPVTRTAPILSSLNVPVKRDLTASSPLVRVATSQSSSVASAR
jgi:hypothetical protein